MKPSSWPPGPIRGLEMGIFGENLYDGRYRRLGFSQGGQRANPGAPDRAKRVVVVGGGYAALDAARAAVRLGAKVHLVYRRTEKDLPADPLEFQAAQEEGVQFHFLTTPTKIAAKNNRVTGLECMQLEPRAHRYQRPAAGPAQGRDGIHPAGRVVISAVGLKPELPSFSAAVLLRTAIRRADPDRGSGDPTNADPLGLRRRRFDHRDGLGD